MEYIEELGIWIMDAIFMTRFCKSRTNADRQPVRGQPAGYPRSGPRAIPMGRQRWRSLPWEIVGPGGLPA